jgi:hypothetical protein
MAPTSIDPTKPYIKSRTKRVQSWLCLKKRESPRKTKALTKKKGVIFER